MGKNLGHLMLDIETLGNKSNSAILSIGAIEFDIETGETGKQFYKIVDLQSCLDVGLKITASTFYWWLGQNENARKEITSKGYHIAKVLQDLTGFIKALDSDTIQVWGNGIRFDAGILNDAYSACGYVEIPWRFRNERDVRTLVSFAPEIKDRTEFIGDLHNPIDDCLFQIRYCHTIWNKKIKK